MEENTHKIQVKQRHNKDNECGDCKRSIVSRNMANQLSHFGCDRENTTCTGIHSTAAP